MSKNSIELELDKLAEAHTVFAVRAAKLTEALAHACVLADGCLLAPTAAKVATARAAIRDALSLYRAEQPGDSAPVENPPFSPGWETAVKKPGGPL